MKTQINNIFRGGGLLAALFLMGTSSVYAATTAGTDVTNTASVTFRTAAGGTTDQNGTGDTETFDTDRLVNMSITAVDADVDVFPGQPTTGFLLVRSFNVTNLTNGIIDFDLSVVDQPGDDFDTGGEDILWESGASQAYDGVGETNSDLLDDVAANATFTVHIITTAIPGTPVNLDTDGVYLRVQASDPGTGTDITGDSASDGLMTVDNVVNDGDGDGAGGDDAARNGADIELAVYTVRTAAISLSKSSTALYDPVNCSVMDGAQDLAVTCADTAFRIPGARVVYRLVVSNAAATSEADATLVNISDTLDGVNTTYVAGSLYRIATNEAGVAGAVCYSGGGALDDDTAGGPDDEGSVTGSTVSFVESALAEGDAVVYCYKVTIN